MDDTDVVPPAAKLVRDFINTYEPQVDQESLTTPSALSGWLAERRLLPENAQLDPENVAAAVTLREGLRAVLLRHAGHAADGSAIEKLNETLAELPLRLTFADGSSGYRLSSATDTPFGLAVGQLADAIRASTQDGSWLRLKVCSRDTCRWAFYDASRNQVRRWCSMAGCGNHIKMQRAYAARKGRQRQATAATGGSSA